MKNPEIDKNGNKFWYNDKHELHRKDGSAIEWNDGTKEWYINGKLHREDGPAIEWNDGDKWWYINGKRHREDGPAAEYHNGNMAWYYNGGWLGSSLTRYTQEDFERYLKIKEYW